MENKQEQFVAYPHPENEKTQPDLDPKDKLIYLSIRRYMNKHTQEAFPSYARITEDTGAAAKTIKKCVDNLVREKYLETRKEGRKIIYKFNDKRKFEPFSYDFLDKPDLTFTEKSYIVATQQYMIKDEETCEGRVTYKNGELAQLIKMSPSTISRCNHSLEKKGYLEGASDYTKRFQMRELDQMIIWKLRDHEDRISKLERQVYEQNARLQEQDILIKKLQAEKNQSSNENENVYVM